MFDNCNILGVIQKVRLLEASSFCPPPPLFVPVSFTCIPPQRTFALVSYSTLPPSQKKFWDAYDAYFE